MTTYNHDEFFQWLTEQPERVQNAFKNVMDQLLHIPADEIRSAKTDSRLRSHFVEFQWNDSTPKEFICIQMAYWINRLGEVSMQITQVSIFDDKDQMNLYISMEATRASDAMATKPSPQFN